MGEFFGNNANSETNSIFPFFANYRYHPQIQADLSPAKESENGQARTLVKTLEELQDILKLEMSRAEEYEQKTTNRRRVSSQHFSRATG